MSKDVMIELKFGGGTESAATSARQSGKTFEQKLGDTILNNGVYGKMFARPRIHYLPTFDFGEPWSSARFASPVIPMFVEPERPAPTPEPQPQPDTPAVAVLRKLLTDRQGSVGRYEGDIKDSQYEIADLEQQLTDARAELEHQKTCAAAAQAEVDSIKADIVKLGGVVEDEA